VEGRRDLKGSAADWWCCYPSTILNRVDLSERGCVYIVSFVVHAGCCDLSTSRHGSDLVQEIVQYGRGPLCAQRALGMDRWAVILASVAWYGSVCFVAISLVYTAFVSRAVCIHRR
jgi:hypothetical protein